jgi:hypothetical protein
LKKIRASCVVKKLPKVNNQPTGESSPNLAIFSSLQSQGFFLLGIWDFCVFQ